MSSAEYWTDSHSHLLVQIRRVEKYLHEVAGCFLRQATSNVRSEWQNCKV